MGITLFVLMTVLTVPALSAQASAPSAKVLIESTSIAAGIGMSWGDGKLSFNGKRYYFVIDGLTFIDFGFSRSSAAGEVYNLTDLAKFEGNYVAAEAGIALAGGIGAVALRNQYGVVMYLRSVSQGARLQLGAGGMSIRFWDQRY